MGEASAEDGLADAQALVTFLRGFVNRSAEQVGHASGADKARESP